MKISRLLLSAVTFIVSASLSRADDKQAAPAAAPAPAASAAAPTQSGGCDGESTILAVQAPCGGSVGCLARNRHPIWDWLTYVPSRRPIIDGNCCNRKQPNIQPPLYDYFPGDCCGCSSNGCGNANVYRYPQARWVNPLLGRPGANMAPAPVVATNAATILPPVPPVDTAPAPVVPQGATVVGKK